MKEKGYVRIGRLFGGNAEVILGLYLIEWLIESNEIKYEQTLRTEKHSDWISWSLFSRMHREFMSKHCIGIIKLEYYESSNVIGIFTAGHIRAFNMLDFAEELSVQFSSVTQLCLTLCGCMDHSMPAFPVHHQLLELAQTHVHRVSDAIQPSHPLYSPSPLAFNLSQHQGLFQWVSSLHQVAKVLEFQLQHQSFQWRTLKGCYNTRFPNHIWLFLHRISDRTYVSQNILG